MGVPGFFRYIVKNYKSDYLSESKPKTVDNLFFDFNGLLHPMCFKILDTLTQAEVDDLNNCVDNTLITSLQKRMIDDGIIPYLEDIVKLVQPRQLVYIAIDGVAPMAKCSQQRSRRWKSSIDAREMSTMKEKWKVAQGPKWTNASISPGTKFMIQIMDGVSKYCKQRRTSWETSYGCKVIFNTARTPGEGEHKIMNYLRNPRVSRSSCNVIYGLDADLIFLSMGLDHNVFLLRESTEFDKKKSIKKEPVKLAFKYLNINRFTDIVVSQLHITKWDFICLCTFIGNDFIPNLPSVNVYDDGLDTLFKIYRDVRDVLTGSRLVYLNGDNLMINPIFLHEIFTRLGNLEDQVLKESRSSAKHKRRPPKLSEYKLEVWQRDNLVGDWSQLDRYMLGQGQPDEWKERWYGDIDQDVMCDKYIEGMQWTLQYYHNGQTDWEWHYPWLHGPFPSDLSRSPRRVSRLPVNTSPLKSTWQLLLIMPREYDHLVPIGYSNARDSVLKQIFPEDIEIDYTGKTQQWQGKPILPPIPENYSSIMETYDQTLLPRETMSNRTINKLIPPILF